MSSSSLSSTLTCRQVLKPSNPTLRLGSTGQVLANNSVSSSTNSKNNSNNNTGGDFSISLPSSQSPAWQVNFSMDGKLIAVAYGAPSNAVLIYQEQGIVVPPVHNSGDEEQHHSSSRYLLVATLNDIQERTIRSVAFAPLKNSSTLSVLATASFDGTVCVWQSSTTTITNMSSSSSDGDVTSSSSSSSLFDTWTCAAQLEGHENEVKCVVWNETGSLLATAGRDKTIWIWECWLPDTVGGDLSASSLNKAQPHEDFDCLAVLSGQHEGDVKCIVFCQSHGQWGEGDEILISGSYDETIRIWAEDVEGEWYCAQVLRVSSDASAGSSGTVWSLSVASSHARFVSAHDDGSLGIYKVYTIAEQQQQQQKKTTTTTTTTAAIPTTGTWKCVGRLPNAHYGTAYSVACAPRKVGHGRMASCGGWDQRLVVYREVIPRATSQTQQQAPFFAVDATVRLDSEVHSVCWHPYKGHVLATACDDGTVQLWDYHAK